MISFRNVQKSYPERDGKKIILDGIDLTFPRGQNTAIIGPNGAGKSTLMRLLSGAEMPDSGTIRREGSVSWPLGFKGGLHGSLTGRENIAFISRVYNRDFAEMLDFVESFADIGKNINEQVKTYSSGMKARVAFGMSMAIKFDYYLIDEVIAVGDISFKKKCKVVLSERLESATVILISHSNSLMREFCTHGLLLKDGKVESFPKLNDAIRFYEKVYS